LQEGKLRHELNKTYFLANLATFGITGSMLARYGAQGAGVWVKVVGVVLSHVGEGWGRWAEGVVEVEDEDVRMVDDPSDEDEPTAAPTASCVIQSVSPPSKPKRQIRLPLPKNVGPKLLLLASPAHLSTLASFLTSPTSKAPTSLLVDFAQFVLALLAAFRGSPRWEGILDGLIAGSKGRALGRRLWREGVKGRLRNSGEKSGWEHFNESG
jgi:ubiquitin-protein ligase E3 C